MLKYISLTAIIVVTSVRCGDAESIPGTIKSLIYNNTDTNINNTIVNTVAVGSAGFIFNGKYNGTTWTVDKIYPTKKQLYSITYANNLWITAGKDKTLISSDNGIDWSIKTLPETTYKYSLKDTSYNNGKWFAVGSYGTIIESNDNGETWNIIDCPTNKTLNSISYANGLWVTVGQDATIVTSNNGIMWSVRNTPDGDYNLYNIIYSNGLWIAVGDINGSIITSPDGINWSMQTIPIEDIVLYKIAYGNGIWVAVGTRYLYSTNDVEDSGIIMVSNDAINWHLASNQPIPVLTAVSYSNGLWIIVGVKGSVLTSLNGENWHIYNCLESADFMKDIAIGE